MDVAVIGWGSLIWCKRGLRIKSPWQADGPKLPVEFARRSNDGRVTLVIHFEGNVGLTRTFWALSEYENLEEARENLRKREGMKNVLDVHGVTREGIPIGPPRGLTSVFPAVAQWLKNRGAIDAAIWTGLKSNWNLIPELEQPLSPTAVVHYLKSLQGGDLTLAKEYFVKAPRHIDTPVRREVIKKLKWVPDAGLGTAIS